MVFRKLCRSQATTDDEHQSHITAQNNINKSRKFSVQLPLIWYAKWITLTALKRNWRNNFTDTLCFCFAAFASKQVQPWLNFSFAFKFHIRAREHFPNESWDYERDVGDFYAVSTFSPNDELMNRESRDDTQIVLDNDECILRMKFQNMSSSPAHDSAKDKLSIAIDLIVV